MLAKGGSTTEEKHKDGHYQQGVPLGAAAVEGDCLLHFLRAWQGAVLTLHKTMV